MKSISVSQKQNVLRCMGLVACIPICVGTKPTSRVWWMIEHTAVVGVECFPKDRNISKQSELRVNTSIGGWIPQALRACVHDGCSGLQLIFRLSYDKGPTNSAIILAKA